MSLYQIKNNNLEPIKKVNFKYEKDLQKLTEQNLEKLFNLQFVETEFSVDNLRIDTLAYNKETSSFVIIEYKRDKNYSVIDQGYSYLSILLNNKAEFVLMDSLNKRIKFLDAVKEELGLSNVTNIHSRAEDLARNASHREHYDFAVSRAVANLSTLTEYCLPFVKIGGTFVSYKSEKLSEELSAASSAIHLLGGKAGEPISFLLPNSDIYRSLLPIIKTEKTAKKYPRKAGLPSKEPL